MWWPCNIVAFVRHEDPRIWGIYTVEYDNEEISQIPAKFVEPFDAPFMFGVSDGMGPYQESEFVELHNESRTDPAYILAIVKADQYQANRPVKIIQAFHPELGVQFVQPHRLRRALAWNHADQTWNALRPRQSFDFPTMPFSALRKVTISELNEILDSGMRSLNYILYKPPDRNANPLTASPPAAPATNDAQSPSPRTADPADNAPGSAANSPASPHAPSSRRPPPLRPGTRGVTPAGSGPVEAAAADPSASPRSATAPVSAFSTAHRGTRQQRQLQQQQQEQEASAMLLAVPDTVPDGRADVAEKFAAAVTASAVEEHGVVAATQAGYIPVLAQRFSNRPDYGRYLAQQAALQQHLYSANQCMPHWQVSLACGSRVSNEVSLHLLTLENGVNILNAAQAQSIPVVNNSAAAGRSNTRRQGSRGIRSGGLMAVTLTPDGAWRDPLVGHADFYGRILSERFGLNPLNVVPGLDMPEDVAIAEKLDCPARTNAPFPLILPNSQQKPFPPAAEAAPHPVVNAPALPEEVVAHLNAANPLVQAAKGRAPPVCHPGDQALCVADPAISVAELDAARAARAAAVRSYREKLASYVVNAHILSQKPLPPAVAAAVATVIGRDPKVPLEELRGFRRHRGNVLTDDAALFASLQAALNKLRPLIARQHAATARAAEARAAELLQALEAARAAAVDVEMDPVERSRKQAVLHDLEHATETAASMAATAVRTAEASRAAAVAEGDGPCIHETDEELKALAELVTFEAAAFLGAGGVGLDLSQAAPGDLLLRDAVPAASIGDRIQTEAYAALPANVRRQRLTRSKAEEFENLLYRARASAAVAERAASAASLRAPVLGAAPDAGVPAPVEPLPRRLARAALFNSHPEPLISARAELGIALDGAVIEPETQAAFGLEIDPGAPIRPADPPSGRAVTAFAPLSRELAIAAAPARKAVAPTPVLPSLAEAIRTQMDPREELPLCQPGLILPPLSTVMAAQAEPPLSASTEASLPSDGAAAVTRRASPCHTLETEDTAASENGAGNGRCAVSCARVARALDQVRKETEQISAAMSLDDSPFALADPEALALGTQAACFTRLVGTASADRKLIAHLDHMGSDFIRRCDELIASLPKQS